MADSLTLKTSPSPRLTFGLIVLNGEPFTRYWLRSVYPWAHQIVISEGATRFSAANVGPDGHSTDGTLDIIRAFQEKEDVEKKVILVTAEDEGHPNGFWPGEKIEMCQAFAKKATGDFLVTPGVDEFYRDEDYPVILETLKSGATHVCFNMVDFWGSPEYTVDSFWTRLHLGEIDRIMSWGTGYHYVEHRPPTVIDNTGLNVSCRKRVSAGEMERLGVRLLHFSHLFPGQIVRKSRYYSAIGMYNLTVMDRWADECYLQLRRPFHVHNVYRHMSWLSRYKGMLPEQVRRMMDDIRTGKIQVEMRRTDDVERLLARPGYMLAGRMLKWWACFIALPFGRWVYRWLNSAYIRLPRCMRVLEPPYYETRP